MAICMVGSLAFAQEATTKHAAEASADSMVLRGVLIDNLNADANNADLPEYIKTYTRVKALKPESLARGFSIYAEGMRYPFDAVSCGKVSEFIKTPGNKIHVSAIVKKASNNEVTLVSIENQI